MTETTQQDERQGEKEASEPVRQAAPETRASSTLLLRAMPGLAVGAWAAAAVLALARLNPWGAFAPEGFEALVLYGWVAPDWLVYVLLAVSLAALVTSLWRRSLLFAYASIVPLVPLGTGDRLLTGDAWFGGDVPWALGFAVLLFLQVEYLTGRSRFQAIVENADLLSKQERRQADRFLLRYMVNTAVLVLVYVAALAGFVNVLLPALAGLISERMGDGLEVRTALGIAVWSIFLLSVPVLGRLLYDGSLEWQHTRRLRAAEQAEQDVGGTE